MTREEAIKELKIFSGTTKTRLSANFWKAFEMAIKALSEESCGDCVSREQALKELKESAEHHANDSREEILLRRDRDIIRALPLVTHTRKKGEWMRHEERKPLKYGYELIIKGKCSNCEEVYYETHRMKYCPNCGAEMEK